MVDRLQSASVRVAVLIAVLVLAAIYYRMPWLNGISDEWRWPYQLGKAWCAWDLFLAIGVIGFVAAGVGWIERGVWRGALVIFCLSLIWLSWP